MGVRSLDRSLQLCLLLCQHGRLERNSVLQHGQLRLLGRNLRLKIGNLRPERLVPFLVRSNQPLRLGQLRPLGRQHGQLVLQRTLPPVQLERLPRQQLQLLPDGTRVCRRPPGRRPDRLFQRTHLVAQRLGVGPHSAHRRRQRIHRRPLPRQRRLPDLQLRLARPQLFPQRRQLLCFGREPAPLRLHRVPLV